MQTTKIFKTAWLCAAMLAVGLTMTSAQTIASWTGASGGEWNTGANWDTGFPPLDATTNAFIPSTISANYNLPMTATGFGALTNSGVLNLNASGFNCASLTMTNNASRLFVNNGGVVNISGGAGLISNAVVFMNAGSSMTVNGTLTLGGGVAATGFAIFTNNGGALTLGGLAMNPNNQSINSSCRFVITGGTNNLGAVAIQRSPGGNSAPPTFGTDGLIISNGFVNSTSISLGNNAHGIIYLVGGTMTNAGTFTIRNSTTTRPARFLQTGGLFVNADPNLVVMNPSATTGDTVYSVLGGTNIVGGFQFGSGVNVGVVFFTNAATIYVGGAGISSNGAVTINALLNAGGRFGAKADWTNAAPITLNGGSFDAQDAAGTPHNIYSMGLLRGSGALIKTGGGNLTLRTNNTYSGNTFINAGTLTLDLNATNATPKVIVGSGTIFDVSAVTGGYTLGFGQTLSGSGTVTGAVTVAAGGIINPGSNSVTGTLNFSNTLTEAGLATNHFDLAAAPGPNNDLMILVGDLTVSATNTIEISGGSSGQTYPLIQYGGNFNGGITNFALSGATGILSNSVAAKTIYLISLNTTRSPTNIVWVGNTNVLTNTWDVTVTTNWSDGGVLDFFISGDNVRFDNTGAVNPLVNLVGGVTPGSITVDTTSNYTFTGTGSIGDKSGFNTGLIKTNSGTLTVLTTNNYTGPTIILGGTFEASTMSNGLSPSSIGAANPDPANLVLTNGSTLRYIGSTPTSTDRGITLGGTGGTIDVVSTLTLSGSLAGGGGLTKTGNGNLILSSLNGYSGGTFLNAGTLTLNNAGAAGAGTITLNGGILAIGAVKPANTVNIAVTSLIQGGNNGGLTGIGNVTGSADFTIAVGTQTNSVFDLTGDMTAYSGTITFSNNDTGIAVVRFNGATGSELATWDLGIGPTMDLNVRTSSQLNNLGALKGAAGTTLSGRGGASNNGPTTYAIGANGQNTTFYGVIQNGLSGASSTVLSITKVGTGTLTLTTNNTYTGTTTVSNGVLALAFNGVTDGSIGGSTVINVTPGAFLDVSARSDTTLPLGSTQQLRGRGTVNGRLNTTGGGTVAPGGGPGGGTGVLTVTNTITLGGTAWMKLNRTGSPTSDKLVSSLSSITYGGTLIVTNIGDPLQVGDSFTLFSGTSLPGSFTLQLPGFYAWDTTQLGVNGSITVTAILTPPVFLPLNVGSLVSDGIIAFHATNGPLNYPVTLLSTTNIAKPLSQWTDIYDGSFDGNGHFDLTLDGFDPNAPQQYFLLRSQ